MFRVNDVLSMHALRYYHEWCERFFAQKKYSRNFIQLWLNDWHHMDFFSNVLMPFLGLERGSCIAVYGGSESSRMSSKIS